MTDKLILAGLKFNNGDFSPHITLGREIIANTTPWQIEPFEATVHHIDLIKSEYVDGNLTYTAIYSIGLSGMNDRDRQQAYNQYYNVANLCPICDENKEFFDFILTTGQRSITDYSLLEREIIVKDNGVLLGGLKEKRVIKSIGELLCVINEFISKIKMVEKMAFLNINDYLAGKSGFLTCPFSERCYVSTCESEELEFVAHQLAFDIFFDGYIRQLPNLTLNQYCEKYVYYDWEDEGPYSKDAKSRAIERTRKWMITSIRNEIERKADQRVINTAERLGHDLESHVDFLGKLNERYKKTKPSQRFFGIGFIITEIAN